MAFPLLIASDHAGFDLKTELLKEESFLNQNAVAQDSFKQNLKWEDLGCFNKERTDYPDWADKLCDKLTQALQKKLTQAFGVLICGTGQGMAIRANRWKQVRASLCWNEKIAFLARNHNQANVLCLPAHFINKKQALNILEIFLKTHLHPDPTYKRRVEKLSV